MSGFNGLLLIRIAPNPPVGGKFARLPLNVSAFAGPHNRARDFHRTQLKQTGYIFTFLPL